MPDAEGQRLLTAFDLHEFGVRLFRQRIALERPEATPDQLDAAVMAWLRDRPGAEHGDGVGVVSQRFR